MKQLWHVLLDHPYISLAGVTLVLTLLPRLLMSFFCFMQWLSDSADRSFIFLPYRIRVEPAPDREWTQAPAVQTLITPLQQAGFVECGPFKIWEMPNTKMFLMVQPETYVTAVIYNLAGRVWMDLRSRFEDGTSLTVTNTGIGGSFQTRPGHPTHRWPDSSAAELYQRLLADRPEKPLHPVAADSAAADFQSDYAEHSDWQSERGGYSAEEIQAEVIASGARQLNAQELAYFRERHAANALSNWWRSQPNPPFPWEDVKDQLIIIHDDLTFENVAHLYGKHDWELNEKDIPPGITTAREAFLSLNANPNGLRPYTKVWEKTTGLAADFYVAFEQEEEEEEQRQAA